LAVSAGAAGARLDFQRHGGIQRRLNLGSGIRAGGTLDKEIVVCSAEALQRRRRGRRRFRGADGRLRRRRRLVHLRRAGATPQAGDQSIHRLF
jgi:hypothetical protein